MKRFSVFFVAISLFFFFPMKAFASSNSICHVHSENCYESQYIVCNDEKVMEIYNKDFFCNTCQRMAAARVVIERYSCKYDTYVREARRSAYCYSCNGVVMYQEGNGKESHTRIGDVCICGLNPGSIVATLSLSKNSTEWTNGNVLLTANISEKVSGVSLSPYTYQFSGGTVSGNTCAVSENGSYTVTVTGKTGQKATTSIQVSNIDKVAPIIEKCYVDKEYPEYDSANIVVEGRDTLSGLADKPYSFDGGKTYVANHVFPITVNGSYTIGVKDKAGNYTTKTLEVTCFEVRPVEPEKKPKEDEKPSMEKEEGKDITNVNGTKNPLESNVSNNSNNSQGMSNANTKIPQNMNETIQNVKENLSKGKNRLEAKESEKDSEKEALLQKLENRRISLEQIPGVYSSLMKQNAEKYALSSITETEDTDMSDLTNEMENREEKGTFSNVSKGVVFGSVLLCIGMVAFLLVFLAKKL